VLNNFNQNKMRLIRTFVLAFTALIATSNLAFSQTSSSDQTGDSLKTAIAKVKGITCSMDLKMISANVEKLKGVSSCKTGKQGTTTTFKIEYNPALVTEKEIFAVIENTGSCDNPDERPYTVKQ